MRVLVTGGCGFLGSHFVRAWLRRHSDSIVVNADCLTYAGSLDNLEDAASDPRHRHERIDVADQDAVDGLFTQGFDLIVHFAAETHVDRSLEDAGGFVRTNVRGTENVLKAAGRRRMGTEPVTIIISTDEVYGPTPQGVKFGTDTPLTPTSPYAASKAVADRLALAYARAYELDLSIVRSVNVYGPRQYPEKVIPLFITRALAAEPLPLYGDGLQSRSWLYVDDFVDGVIRIADQSAPRRDQVIWHLGSPNETRNLDLAEAICRLCDADPALITSVPDRPGHDRRYALDFAPTEAAFDWRPRTTMDAGLEVTVNWMKANLDWCRRRTNWTPAFLRGN